MPGHPLQAADSAPRLRSRPSGHSHVPCRKASGQSRAAETGLRPMAREGGMFKRAWFEGKFVESIDIQPGTKWVRHWDLASSTSAQAAYTVGQAAIASPAR